MYGYVLSYSVQTGEGIVSGDDGNRYAFTSHDWLDAELPARNDRVDFTPLGSSAARVFVTERTYLQEWAPPPLSNIPAVATGCGVGVGCFLLFIGLYAYPGVGFGRSLIESVIGYRWYPWAPWYWIPWGLEFHVSTLLALVLPEVFGYLAYQAVRSHRR